MGQVPQRLHSDLLEKVRPLVLSWVAGKTSDPDDAEDITQLVMLRLMTHLRTFRGESRFSSWLYRITANEVSGFYRGRWRETRGLDEQAVSQVPCSAYPIHDRLDGERLRAAVSDMASNLPPLQRAALHLVDLGGLKPCEAARALGKTEVNLRSSLCRARRKIRELVVSSRQRLVAELISTEMDRVDARRA
jgi:RNA polymerase sigma-70 factor (ECF subfamily)